MSEYKGRRLFRSSPAYVVIVTVAALLFVSGGWFWYSTRGWTLMTLAFAVMSVIGVLGVIEAIVDRVILTDDALRIIRIWSRRTYPKSQIAGVTSEKGALRR